MIIKGDIWDHYQNYQAICCTCNEITTKKYYPYEHDELVMGAGIALSFKKKFPDLPRIWGDRLIRLEKRYGHKPLMMITHPGLLFNIEKNIEWKYGKHPYLVYFKTKLHWKDSTPKRLIDASMAELCDYIDLLGWNSVLLPCPGCQNGGLNWEKDVRPILEPYLNDYSEIDIIMKD